MIKTPRGLSGDPRSTDIDDQRPGVFEYSMERLAKRSKPIHVLISINVAVGFLAHQTKRRTCDNQVDRGWFYLVL